MTLTEKYRPRRLADLLGQPWVVDQLQLFLESPHSTAFCFAGPTGTGKTSAALCLAAELGILVEQAEYSGLWQIASGEQTGETVRRMMERLRVTPLMGSGWRCLVVNEADCLTPNAAYVWLDALENLPPRTVVVFTTNELKRLPQRLRDRCECFEFQAGALTLRPDLQALAARVWAAEVGGPCPDVETFGPVGDERGEVSFRRLLQRMEPAVRARGRTVPQPVPVASTPIGSSDLKKIWERRLAGMTWGILSRELNLPETTIRGRLYRAGLMKKVSR